MRTAKDIMTTDPVTARPETEILDAAKILLGKGFNGMPVVDESGNLVGIITQSDLVSQQKRLHIPSVFAVLDGFVQLSSMEAMEREIQKISAVNVGQAMTPHPVSVPEDTSVEDIATLMVERKIHSLPVVRGDKLVGIVGKEDVLRTLLPGS